MKKKILKYSATGNTFLVFDNMSLEFDISKKSFWNQLCIEYDVDGILFLFPSEDYDFSMRYLNKDGGEVEMCGNGARALSHYFCHTLKNQINIELSFTTMNGLYYSSVKGDRVNLQMTELKDAGAIEIKDLVESSPFSFYINTGVPHCVFQVKGLNQIDILESGKHIRWDKRFPKGCNSNFFEFGETSDVIKMRTFERGVEDETLSCGTGITATSISLGMHKLAESPLTVLTRGGEFKASWNDDFSKVFLEGSVEVLGKKLIEF